jgi:NAD(P)-dependent dehydrogenase (short-subunit alcohol dehydrogenase family)
MSAPLQGKVAIVTGAGQGIGRAEAITLARAGARVVVNDIRPGADVGPSSADQVVAEIVAFGGEAIARHGSVAEMRTGEELVRAARDRWQRLDIVVSNAGVARSNLIWDLAERQWDDVIAVHLKGHFVLARAASGIFRGQRSGRLIGTSSDVGIMGNMGMSAYAAAKEGIAGLYRGLARDLGRYGVTANVIRPAAATPMTAGTGMENSAEFTPGRVAEFVTWLCTDAAADVNGQDFGVMGNRVWLHSRPKTVATIVREGGWTPETLDTLASQGLGEAFNRQGPGVWEPTGTERRAARSQGYQLPE